MASASSVACERHEQIRNASLTRHDQPRSELVQGLEGKRALVQARMRHDQPRLVDDGVAVHQEVEVDRPRPEAFLPHPAESALDVEQDPEERPRLEARLDLDRTVEKPRLLDGTPRLRLTEAGDRYDLEPEVSVEELDGVLDRPLTVAEVRSEADVRTHRISHNDFLTDQLTFCSSRRDTIGMTHVAVNRLVFAVAAVAASTTVGPSGTSAAAPATIVRLTNGAACTAPAHLAAAGGTQIDAQLRLWRVPARLLSGLRARRAVAASQPARTYRVAQSTVTPDPLEAQETWRQQIGIDGLTPPGPGVPITIVDSGVDFAHPEFAGRPDLVALNSQEPIGVGGEHGTSVASVIGAPANGVGGVGIYPQAVLRSWDAALGSGTRLDSGQIAAGILAAARAGHGVINLSVGGNRDLAIELAVNEAVALGSLVVAASGNSGEEGSPIGYPAALPHVTTVAATDATGRVASFSSRSPYVDLAAPGVGILVASAINRNWQPEDGTSFSSPIVAGAAAWLWTARPELTARQVAEMLRRSARDIGQPGRDTASGFGELDLGAALVLPAPIDDPFEPNDDINQVNPVKDMYLSKEPPLTTATRRVARIAGRVDEWEDPRDVFRVWLPAHRRVVAKLSATDNSDLSLFSSTAPTVFGRFATAGRLARANATGATERLVYDNATRGRWAYLAVSLPPTTASSTYRLSLSSAALKKRAPVARR
jgi:hypothetical protein